MKLLQASDSKVKSGGNDEWKEKIYDNNQQSLTLNQPNTQDLENSPFLTKLNEICDAQLTNENYLPLFLPNDVISTLSKEEVHFQDFRRYCPTMPVKYFKNLVTEISLVNCKWCSRFFVLVIQ